MMGKPDDVDSCVDTNFRVHGLDSLRVADLSVCPLTAKYVLQDLYLNPQAFVNSLCSNHPQSLAYLIGEKAARSIIAEWKL